MTLEIGGRFRGRERDLLEDLRARFQNHGYRFESEPSQLPSFFGDYRPDAIALKAGRNVVIEVKRQPGPSSNYSLAQIRKLLEGHPDWELRVVFTGGDVLDELTIARADPARIRQARDEVHALMATNRLRLAFMSAWSLLETCSLYLGGSHDARPSRPEAVVQSLASEGFINPTLERRLHDLVVLRNRVVHGDLDAEPTPDDVAVVLSGIDEAMSAMVG